MGLGWSKEEAEDLMQDMVLEAGCLAATGIRGVSTALDLGIILQPVFSGLYPDLLTDVGVSGSHIQQRNRLV